MSVPLTELCNRLHYGELDPQWLTSRCPGDTIAPLWICEDNPQNLVEAIWRICPPESAARAARICAEQVAALVPEEAREALARASDPHTPKAELAALVATGRQRLERLARESGGDDYARCAEEAHWHAVCATTAAADALWAALSAMLGHRSHMPTFCRKLCDALREAFPAPRVADVLSKVQQP